MTQAGGDASNRPGRTCPLHYRYSPAVFASPPSTGFADCDVLYVAGGLYGNEPALERLLELFDRERGRKRLVFNGDFHWFDVDPAVFSRIQRRVLEFGALRGNVETELAAADAADDGAGCGCGYPEWVDDDVVDRSNRILGRLRRTAAAVPDARERLAALPAWLRADVAGMRVAIVHGDAESLAGWGFSAERLREPAHRRRVAGWFAEAGVDAFACTHTCLPVFRTLPDEAGRGFAPTVLNNGAVGMPNFAGDAAGLVTRIATAPFAGLERRFGMSTGGVHIEAIAVDYDDERWRRTFVGQWPPGSVAHASYWERIVRGPAYEPSDAFAGTAGGAPVR
jgi:hypothetical protein